MAVWGWSELYKNTSAADCVRLLGWVPTGAMLVMAGARPKTRQEEHEVMHARMLFARLAVIGWASKLAATGEVDDAYRRAARG